MPPLPSDLRRNLERAVVRARDTAEAGAANALAVLGVADEHAPGALGQDDRQLRIGLRAQARSLGGGLTLEGVAGLREQIAYAVWHRMLFARFLAENGLLVHPSGAPVSMGDVVELAREQGEPDPWALAARYAASMLPGIFGTTDPTTQVVLAPDDRLRLEEILRTLPSELFVADDALGWVYQFWQSKRKDEVNRRGDKIGGADIAPVTQLFTEHYMVRFLLENSLGAWWAGRHSSSPLLREWEYLRFRDDGTPAAGSFEAWPARAAEVTVMDPCLGSGHFLVAAADMLRKMRTEEEGLSAGDAAEAVLRDNLFGLELDPRCTQLAAFALAFDAWKAAGGYRSLPVPNIACSGLAVKGQLDDWRRLAAGDDNLRVALERLYALFQDAPELGSLIDPRAAAGEGLWAVDPERLLATLDQALKTETDDPAAAVFGAAAQGTAKAAQLLTRRYWLVTTNPPYLVRGKQSDILRIYCGKWFLEGASDLATVFVVRSLQIAVSGGTTALLTPQNWLYLQSYAALRRSLLADSRLRALATIGSGATSTASWEVTRALTIIDRDSPRPDDLVSGVAVPAASETERATGLSRSSVSETSLTGLKRNPDARFAFGADTGLPLLRNYADSYQGIATADYARFGRVFWEPPAISSARWAPQQSTVGATELYGGREHAILWEDGAGVLKSFPQAAIRGTQALGRVGIAITQTRNLPATIFSGTLFDNNTAALIPRSDGTLSALWAFVTSPHFVAEVRRIDQKLFVTNATLTKVPFDLEHWTKVAAEQYPNGLPEPHSDDPSQWLFKGNIVGSEAPLQVAVARLLGYRWPDQESDVLDEFADPDGIVCLPSVGGDAPASQRLEKLLATAYGSAWGPAQLAELLATAGGKARDLETWLRDEFFAQHARLFHNRPFIWQIWDGRRDGFSALLHYHRLDRSTLEKLTFNQLGDWLERQRAAQRANEPAAEARVAAALGLQRNLQLILTGEPPYDSYVRWKSLAEQPIGWEPDLDDGVRLNIRPFVSAGILRDKFTINWNTDRGKNPDGSERLNDLHLTNADKRAAREGRG